MRLNNEAVSTRDKMTPVPYSMEKIENTANPNRNQYVYPANDWYDMLFNENTVNYRANFNVSGGGKVARYYIAATYNQDNGVLKVDKQNNFNNNIDLKRFLLRTNVNINVTKTTEAVVRLHGTFDDYRGPMEGGSDVYQKVMRSDPVLFPATYVPDETYAYAHHILFGNADKAQYINPYADMVKGYKDYSKSKMLAQFELKQNLNFITEGLNLRGLFSTDRYSYTSVSRSYAPYYYAIGYYDKYTDKYTLAALNPDGGREWLSYTEAPKEVNSTTYAEAAVNYDRVFAEKHAVSGMLVYTIRNYIEGNVADLQSSLPHRNLGLSGRVTYAYADRYFTEFNFGYNGSERFAVAERFGFFPSFGVGWIVSNETFWNKELRKTVSKLKLKGTYGLVGNDAIGDANARFFYMSNVNMSDANYGYSFGNEFAYSRTGVSISRYANDKITWETAKKMNLGIELGLFDKIEIIADYYTENRDGILLTRADIPYTSGLQNAVPQANIGKAAGHGLDLSIDYQHNITKDFWITGRANFTYAKTKYTAYEEVDNTLTPWLSHINQPVSQRWGYVAERLFVDDYEVKNSPAQTFGEYAGGDIKYKDINGDGQITSLDRVPIGYPIEPQIIYGFGISTGYKNWDLSFFFQGLAQESFWINTGVAPSTVPFIDTDGNSAVTSKNALLKAYADNHWSEDNKNIYALWPRLSDKMINNNFADWNTWFMRDGSFLRLKSTEFGYTVPQRITEKIKVKNFRCYFSATNLLTFSSFKMWDPEMAGNGLGYPIQRVFNLGLQITF
jgi:TonB-linked SusC/RagA family outer membrane protein